jgi:hypothetical protein
MLKMFSLIRKVTCPQQIQKPFYIHEKKLFSGNRVALIPLSSTQGIWGISKRISSLTETSASFFLSVKTRNVQFCLIFLSTCSIPLLIASWPESAIELYRQRDCRLSAKLVSTLADRWCHVVSLADPYGRIIGFLDWRRYFFFQLAPQLYS